MSQIDYNKIITDLNIKAASSSYKIQTNEDDPQKERFFNNVRALFKQDEILAATLFGMKSQGDFDLKLGKDPIDINISDKSSGTSIYKDPVSQVHSELDRLEKEYKRYPSMYFYGLGNGVLIKGLLHNKSHERVVVVEPKVEIIYIVLHLIDFSEDLASHRLLLFYSKLASYAQFFYMETNSRFSVYARTFRLHIMSEFYDQFSDDYARISKDMTTAIAQMVVSHGNSIDDVLLGTRQHTANIPAMITSYAYRDLIKKRHKMMKTAVIVATGPSLDKQLKTLKKYAPYVSVISLDASLPILAKHGIKPDYVTSIERVEATSTFFEPAHPKIEADTYFIVASVTHARTVRNLKDRRLVLAMRPQQEEMLLKMERFGYVGIGHSTANQAYQLAYVLGHENIVLIGQDLAYGEDGRTHASGHAYPAGQENLYTVAYGGEGEVRTSYIWEKFKNQYEADIEIAKKEENTKTYNCTEGGARINGTIERPFAEVMQELTKDLEPKKLPHINKLSQTDTKKSLLKAYSRLATKVKLQRQAKQKIEKVFLKLAPKIDKFIEIKNSGNISEKYFKELSKITEQIDKAKEIVHQQKYKEYIENVVQISIFYQELDLAEIALAPSETNLEKTKKLIEWIIVHKYWLFSVAGGINADIETTVLASENLKNELQSRGLLDEAVAKYGEI